MLNAELLISKAETETKTFVSFWPGRLAFPLGSIQALDRVALLHLETDLPNDALLQVGTILRIDLSLSLSLRIRIRKVQWVLVQYRSGEIIVHILPSVITK